MGNQNTGTAKCKGNLEVFCRRDFRMIVKAEGKEAPERQCPCRGP